MKNLTLKLDARKRDKYEITAQGFLVVDANLTRAGVFDYYDADGKLIRELRSPEEVFKQASLDSLKFAPLTMQHPKDMVNTSNVAGLQIGMVGENITKRGDYVGGKVVITDKTSIDEILAKWDKDQEAELSMGYEAEVVTMAGTHHKDGPYDKMQTDIKYNHASVVDRGRAGSNVKLIKDSDESNKQIIRDAIDEVTKQTKDTEEKKTMKIKRAAISVGSFRADAILEDVDDGAKGVISTLEGHIDGAVAVIGTMKKDHDELQAKTDEAVESGKALQAKVDELSNPCSKVVQAMITERADLEGVAAKLEVKTDSGGSGPKSSKDLKVAIITKIHPEFKADEKSDEYIAARFDAVVEALAAKKDSDAADTLGKFRKDAEDTKGKDKKEPREDYLEKVKGLHKDADDK